MGIIPKHPVFQYAALAIVLATVAFAVIHDPVFQPQTGPNLCAELPPAAQRDCRLSGIHGDWVVVTSGKSSWIVLLQDGKVMQVSQTQ